MKHLIRQSRVGRAVFALVLVAATLVGAAQASALSRQDIYNLLNSGLSPDLIVNVIRSSTAPVTVTEGEITQMRAEGVPEPILAELCVRVGCGAAPAPGPGPGPGFGTPGLEQEFERQRALEEERRRQDMQRMEEEREAMRRRMAEEEARQGAAQAAIGDLLRAERLLRDRRYVQAASTFAEYLGAQRPAPGSEEYGRALFGYVKAMFGAGYRYSVRQEVLELALMGPQTPFFEEAFDMLATVVSELDVTDPRIEALANMTVGHMSQAFQDRFSFTLGRAFRSFGDAARAQQIFERISADSPERARAYHLSGTMYLAANQNRRAVESFQSAVSAARRTGLQDVEELAHLALARILFSIREYDAALYYYQKIPSASPRRPQAIFETAWAYFMKNDFDRAVGTLHSLHSPFFQRYFWPELYVLEAAAYFETCNLRDAELAVAMFRRNVASMQQDVEQFRLLTVSPEAMWAAVVEYYDRLGTDGANLLPQAAVRTVLRHPEFLAKYEQLNLLIAEAARLRRDGAALGAWTDDLVNEIDAQIEVRRIDAGLFVDRRLEELSNELTDWSVKAQEVDVEITVELRRMIARQREGSVTGEGGTSTFVLAQDWQFWPYEGEYWLDEVEHFRANLTNYRDADNRCVIPEDSL